MFCSTNAQALEAQTLDKLARYPRTWLGDRVSGQLGSGAPQIRPLLDDLVHYEWYLEVQDSAGIAPAFALAIHLPDNRARIWETDLDLLLNNWTGLPIRTIPNGWWLKKDLPPDFIRFLRVGEWVVVSCEQGKFDLGEELVKQINATGRPVPAPTNWLAVKANWDRLARYFPGLNAPGLPETDVQVTGKDGNICWNGKLEFAQPLPAHGDWRIPAGALHQPFTSFTAVRGISGWLQNEPWTQRYLFSPPPDQLFTWVSPGLPFLTFAAAPVSDAHAALGQLNDKLMAQSLPGGNGGGMFSFMPHPVLKDNQIALQGMPFASPFIQGLHGPEGDFIMGGFFPSPPLTKPLPPELLARLNTKDLVFYHWEITAERMPQILNLAQLGLVLTSHKQMDADAPVGKWVLKLTPKLGNTVTTITQSGPAEMTFSRTAPGGLTAAEFFALATWMSADNFPGCNLDLPPHAPRHKRPQPQSTTIISIPAPGH